MALVSGELRCVPQIEFLGTYRLWGEPAHSQWYFHRPTSKSSSDKIQWMANAMWQFWGFFQYFETRLNP